MNSQVAVVIITKNEEAQIRACITAARSLTNEIIVVDAESTDQTVSIASEAGARVVIEPWKGYGYAKNLGNSLAKASWILSIDADEIITPEMCNSIKNLSLERGTIYAFKLVDHIGSRAIRYTEFRPKWKKRLFNKQDVSWNDASVHELLEPLDHMRIEKRPGYIHHHSFEHIKALEEKQAYYGLLGAQKLIDQGNNPSAIKIALNPYWRFFRSYVVYGGFLEGRTGWRVSIALKNMLQIKYQKFKELRSIERKVKNR